MATTQSVRVLPMRTRGTQHLVNRAYRESGAFQWVRETFKNAEEAGATRILFGIEWQAVESQGVYRRLIADNGSGMTPDELVEFFNTFGGSGKPIGGVHENFGIGAKTSLLPWNKHGLVVISWVDGDASMIWVVYDPESGEYGLKVEEVEDPDTGDVSLETVYAPFDDETHGCNWADVKPEWVGDNGTVIVLLGDDPTTDTILGDPNRDEADIKGISSYLNRRIWRLPPGFDAHVDELRTRDKSEWPRTEAIAHGAPPRSGRDRRTNTRKIEGAEYFIDYAGAKSDAGKLEDSGTVSLDDGTGIDWFLWAGRRPAVQSYASIGGYIAAEYKNELYNVSTHHSTYRSFGVSESEVRKNLWLIIRPPLLGEDERHGVYPRADRNSLLLRGGRNPGGELPINEWAAEFADNMPESIRAAIRAARSGFESTVDDESWRKRLAERFGSRWRIPRLRLRPLGPLTVNPDSAGNSAARKKKAKAKRRGRGGGEGGTAGSATVGTSSGTKSAVRAMVAGGIPHYRLVGADQVGEGMIAAWQPNDPDCPEGVVLINVEHPVLRTEIEHWQSQYADHHAEDVAKDIASIYGEIAVAKVAHSEHLKGMVTREIIDNDMRSDAALTMALLGLIGEEAVIAPRLGGKFGRRRDAV